MTYRAGIIGTGGVAGMGILGVQDADEIGSTKVETSHAGGYASNKEIDLVAVADVEREKLDTFGEVWEIPEEQQYLGHEAMLDAEDLDVVSVCSPTYLHAEHAVDAARSAAAPDVVWCEKPLASSVADGEAAIEACEENSTELLVNHSFRFQPRFVRLRELIREEDLLGEIHAAHGAFRMELMRNSTHLLDTLAYLLDARARRVSGYITGEHEATDALGASEDVDDSGGGGTVVTDDGTFLTIDCTVPRADSTMFYHLVGNEGKLQINPEDDEWRFWSLEDGSHVEKPIPELGEREGYERSFVNAATHVIDLLKNEAENRSPGREALRSLEIIAGFYISHYTGSHVTLPLDRPLRDVTIRSW